MAIEAKEAYAEAGLVIRHHLAWRERLFTGYLVIFGALVVAFYQVLTRGSRASVGLGIAGVVVSVLFYLGDRRLGEVIGAYNKVAEGLEQGSVVRGVYREAVELGRSPREVRHTSAIHLFFLFGALTFLGATFVACQRVGVLRSGPKCMSPCAFDWLSRCLPLDDKSTVSCILLLLVVAVVLLVLSYLFVLLDRLLDRRARNGSGPSSL